MCARLFGQVKKNIYFNNKKKNLYQALKIFSLQICRYNIFTYYILTKLVCFCFLSRGDHVMMIFGIKNFFHKTFGISVVYSTTGRVHTYTYIVNVRDL